MTNNNSKNKLTKWFNKQSVGVKSAIIGGVFVLVAAIVSALFEGVFQPKVEIIIYPTVSPLASAEIPQITTKSVALNPRELIKFLQEDWIVENEDNFPDDGLENWTNIQEETNTNINVNIENGVYNINVITSDWAFTKAIFRKNFLTPENFMLSVDSALTINNGCGFGLLFRGDLSNNYYLFGLTSNDNYQNDIKYVITRVTPILDQKRQVLKIDNVANNIGIPHTLTVIGIGNNYYFYVNSDFLDSIHLDIDQQAIRGNRVGLEILVCPYMEQKFSFSNLQIYIPEGHDYIPEIKTTLPTPTLQPLEIELPIFRQYSEPISGVMSTDTVENMEKRDYLDVVSTNFKTFARFNNPKDTWSWSYGYYFWLNDKDWAKAFLRSDSVWKVVIYDSKKERDVIVDFGTVSNLNASPHGYNELELISHKGRILFFVNGIIVSNTMISSVIGEGITKAVVGIDDERENDYSISIENYSLWLEEK